MSAETASTMSRPGRAFGFAALALVAFLMFMHMSVKLLYPIIARNAYNSDLTVVGNILGALGLLSVLLIIGALVLGHLGLSAARRDEGRGAGIAGIALGGAYVLLLLWLNRLILVVVLLAMSGGRFEYFLLAFLQNP